MWTVILVPMVLVALVAIAVLASAQQVRRSSGRSDHAEQDALRMRSVRDDGWHRSI